MSIHLTTEWSRAWEERAKHRDIDSMDSTPTHPTLAEMPWSLGDCDLEVERDPQTGLAKWPLSFKRITRDLKPAGEGTRPKAAPKQGGVEQPPTAA